MTKASRRIIWYLSLVGSAFIGYQLGAGVRKNDLRTEAPSSGKLIQEEIATAPANGAGKQRPVSKHVHQPAARAWAWDPWQGEGDIELPLAFFKNFSCRLLQQDQKLNEAVLAALKLSKEQIPRIQDAYKKYNESILESDLNHRKITRNDNDAVEIEIAAYPTELKLHRDSFNSTLEEVAGEKTATLIDLMIGLEEGMRENRGMHRRVYKMMPQDDGTVQITETTYTNSVERSESTYEKFTRVPIHLQHLFTILDTEPELLSEP